MNGKYQGFFVDPYNSLKIQMSHGSSISTHEYHYEAASEFLTFAKRNDMAVWLNTHAVTEAQRRKGEDGLPVAPYAEDTEGGGKFVNRSDEFFVIHRYTQHPTDWIFTDIHVRKVKELESGGRPTPLDSPIRMESTQGNCGFRINGINLVTKDREIDGSPF